MLRQRWAILPASELPLWLPERIRTKLACSEDTTSRPFMCLLCGLGMGQPSKRKSFQNIDSVWAHFFARHMDGTNVQHLVEKLVIEWGNLETADREAAVGWARDSGRSHGYDVREVLGLTGIPGQNGWRERPRLPREWPPPQLAKGKPKGQAGENPTAAAEGKRPYPFGPNAQKQRAEKQSSEGQRERPEESQPETGAEKNSRKGPMARSEERQPELRTDKRGREEQRERREEGRPEMRAEKRGRETQRERSEGRQTGMQRERREARQPVVASKAFKLIPAQEVEREAKGVATGRSGKRRGRSDEIERRTTLSLKEKRQRRPQPVKDTRSDRSSSSQGDHRMIKVPARRQGRHSTSQKGARRGAETSPSSSLDRLLQDVASSSDDHIERKVLAVKRMSLDDQAPSRGPKACRPRRTSQ
eukprot:2009221-Amphidinium_carterae.1